MLSPLQHWLGQDLDVPETSSCSQAGFIQYAGCSLTLALYVYVEWASDDISGAVRYGPGASGVSERVRVHVTGWSRGSGEMSPMSCQLLAT